MRIAFVCIISEMQNYNIQLFPHNCLKSPLEDFWENLVGGSWTQMISLIVLHCCQKLQKHF